MFLPSACIWGFKEPVVETLVTIKRTAFHSIDVEPDTLAAPGAAEKLRELGLKVSCVALDHHLPAGASLEADSSEQRRRAVSFLRQGLDKAGELGARAAYVAPGASSKRLDAYRTAVSELAEYAAGKGVRLCIEPVPGKALPGAKETLAFLEKAGHSNLYVLLDTGHALLAGEDLQEIVRAAGVRLGYVQVNDNDGRKDRHWALLDGRLKEADLVRMLAALSQVGYNGTLGLELSRKLPSLISSLAKNRNLLMRLQSPGTIKSLQEPETRRKH